MAEETARLLEKADPLQQTSLQSEVIPDEMDGEQTWPTEEELAEGNTGSRSLTWATSSKNIYELSQAKRGLTVIFKIVGRDMSVIECYKSFS